MTRAWHQNVRRSAAIERTIGDIVFDSKSEAARWATLQLMQRAGEIADLHRQVAYPLVIDTVPVRIRSAGFPNGRSCWYTADFTYTVNGRLVIEEHKGVWTPEARLRIAVVEAIYGVEVKITGAAVMTRRKRRVSKKASAREFPRADDAGAK